MIGSGNWILVVVGEELLDMRAGVEVGGVRPDMKVGFEVV